jgi:hypothetical protein
MYNCKSNCCHLNTCQNLSFIHNFIFTNPKNRFMKNNDLLSVLRTTISLTRWLFSLLLTKDISLGCKSNTPNRKTSISTGQNVIIVRCTCLSQMAPHNRFPFTVEPDTLTITLVTSNYKFRRSFVCCFEIFYTLYYLWAFIDFRWLHMNETISRPRTVHASCIKFHDTFWTTFGKAINYYYFNQIFF